MSPPVIHILLGVILLANIYFVDGYPSGAPASTCWTRYPKHKGIGTQTLACPIHITFSSATYTTGADITVTIEDPNPAKQWFGGVQIAAFRDTGNQEEIVGQFVNFPTDKLKSLSCFGGEKNMITHRQAGQVQGLNLTWRAPSENVGNLTFKATIVTNFETFWTQVEGKLLSAVQDAALIVPPKYPGIVARQMVEEIDMSTCGDTKGCFLHPRHCSGANCLVGASFQHRPATDDYQFELYSTTGENYISLGFSDDLIMGEDETITCTGSSGQISIQHGRNPAYYNDRMITRFVSQVEVRQSDGRLHCRFVLPRETSAFANDKNITITYSRDEDRHLMLAWGKTMKASDVLAKHKDMPVTTCSKVNMKSTDIYRGSAFPVLVRVHGALMIIAWIFLSGIVTVVSRHYREWMPKRKLFGTKVWFQVHRELAVLIGILTAIGLIVVFSNYGSEIRAASVPHSYVGLAVTACVGLQLIAGCLRPAPDHKMRVFFNWGHRFLGQSTHILAAVTMFLAFDIEYVNNNMKWFGSAVLIVWVAVQLLWHIAFEILSCKGLPLGPSQKKNDSDKGDDRWDLRTTLFVIYAVTLAGLCTAALLAFLLF